MGKYVKCIDDEHSKDTLELNKSYKVIGEIETYYKLEVDNGWWHRTRFEEIPNPQNPVKSSVSEPINPNKMELLMPVLDIIERLQELEIDKDNIENIITKIESEGTKQEEIKYYENKIEQLEEENADLKAKIYNINIDMRNILTIINGYR